MICASADLILDNLLGVTDPDGLGVWLPRASFGSSGTVLTEVIESGLPRSQRSTESPSKAASGVTPSVWSAA